MKVRAEIPIHECSHRNPDTIAKKNIRKETIKARMKLSYRENDSHKLFLANRRSHKLQGIRIIMMMP